MAKYRIVKVKGYINLHKVEKKVWGLFWVPVSDVYSLEDCERMLYRLRNNPKNVVVKEYEF